MSQPRASATICFDGRALVDCAPGGCHAPAGRLGFHHVGQAFTDKRLDPAVSGDGDLAGPCGVRHWVK